MMARQYGEKLKVTLFSEGEDGYVPDDPTYVDYVSVVNEGTFGPPPLVAPKEGNPPLADFGDEVLYINTTFVPLFTIERVEE